MLKPLLSLFSLVFLVSCTPHHKILDSSYGFSDSSYRILLDAKIDKLRIRHVRMDDEQCVSGYYEHLEISGEIGPDSTEAIGRLLPQLAKCMNEKGIHIVSSVFLSSAGGRLSDGFALGKLFRQYKMQTIITGGQTCASSCAIAFLGGEYRRMYHDAKLMFHAPYTTSGFRSPYGGLSIDCSDRGQVAELKNYYYSVLGGKDGDFLLNRTMSYCSSSSGWTLNSGAAKLLGIINSF